MMSAIGLVIIPIMLVVMLFMATAFTLVAETEQVNIYRSGLILGLMYGLASFVFMVLCVVFLLFYMMQRPLPTPY
ncbi:MAG: hypothetical protein B6U72_03555 [Candidatus Altiarchaeales archaeon ex4484_2]|nr:MAG: hypothetical protein B6U72_03555 [Candidatus Altiarchaeales archaeon ex4484_2]